MKIEKIISYTIPLFGNNRILPYGKLQVSDGKSHKVCDIKESASGEQYITFNRRKYRVKNIGTLYSPRFELI